MDAAWCVLGGVVGALLVAAGLFVGRAQSQGASALVERHASHALDAMREAERLRSELTAAAFHAGDRAALALQVEGLQAELQRAQVLLADLADVRAELKRARAELAEVRAELAAVQDDRDGARARAWLLEAKLEASDQEMGS